MHFGYVSLIIPARHGLQGPSFMVSYTLACICRRKSKNTSFTDTLCLAFSDDGVNCTMGVVFGLRMN